MRSPIIPLLPLFCLAALPAGAMTLKSTDIREGEPMDKVFSFNGFGCSGENRSPQLSWQSLPAGTQMILALGAFGLAAGLFVAYRSK